MDVDIKTLVAYPTNSDDWLLTVTIGGLAVFLSFLILPWFVVSGYVVRVLRAGMDGGEEPPVFDEWGTLLKEGVVAGIIGFIYQLIPLIVFVVFAGGAAMALLTGTDTGTGLGLLGMLASVVIWWGLAIAFGYVGLAGIANYTRKHTFGAGFDVDVISTVITSREYLVAWGYVIGLTIVVGILVSALNTIPILGGLIGAFVGFYALTIAGWLWGAGFAAATESGADTVAETETTVA